MLLRSKSGVQRRITEETTRKKKFASMILGSKIAEGQRVNRKKGLPAMV